MGGERGPIEGGRKSAPFIRRRQGAALRNETYRIYPTGCECIRDEADVRPGQVLGFLSVEKVLDKAVRDVLPSIHAGFNPLNQGTIGFHEIGSEAYALGFPGIHEEW
jgi:hypothetical protein